MILSLITGISFFVLFIVLSISLPNRYSIWKGILLITSTVFILKGFVTGAEDYYSSNLKGKVITIEFK